MRFILISILFMLSVGCSQTADDRKPGADTSPPSKIEEDKAKLSVIKDAADEETDPLKKAKKETDALRLENDIARQTIRDNEKRIQDKESEIRRIRLEEIQTKLYIGAAVLFVIALILGGLGLRFGSVHMLYSAIAAVGLACLALFAGFLTPYIFWIAGIGVLCVVGFTVWLLLGRDKALRQVTLAVNDIKGQVPGYKEIFAKHIDEAQDAIIDATRKQWGDVTVKK